MCVCVFEIVCECVCLCVCVCVCENDSVCVRVYELEKRFYIIMFDGMYRTVVWYYEVTLYLQL